MKKYNLSPEEAVKFLYRGKINRVKESDIYDIRKNPTDKEIQYFKDMFLSKNKYIISYKEIEQAEKTLGITLPEVLKSYYHECGDLNINQCFSYLLMPDNLGFSHQWECENLEDEGTPQNEIEDILAKIPNIFVFWCENQGVWLAGIKKEDLNSENPPVYISTNDDLYSWEKAADSIEMFLFSQILNNLADSEFYHEKLDKKYWKEFLAEEKISVEELEKSIYINLDTNTKIANYADYDKNIFYFFIFSKEEIIDIILIKQQAEKTRKEENEKMANIKSTNYDKTLLEIAKLILRNSKGEFNHKFFSKLKNIFENFEKFLLNDEERDFTKEDIRELSSDELNELKFEVLTELLSDEELYICCLDWKCELDDFMLITEAMRTKGYSEEICEILEEGNLSEDEDITIWCQNFDNLYKNKDILLAGIDMNSDCYAVFPTSYENLEKLQKLADKIGMRIDFAKNL